MSSEGVTDMNHTYTLQVPFFVQETLAMGRAEFPPQKQGSHLDPKSQSLHPKPQTLDPKPKLNPKPQTLRSSDPKPKPFNPKTPNPKPKP